MCGISGIISSENLCFKKKILSSLSALENRGYDSSGVCFIDELDKINIYKKIFQDKKKPIEQLREEIFSKTNIIFGHNRWATHGEKNIKNTHPHISNNKKIVIVHNGIIENFLEIKIFLLKKGFFFYGETDTEIICNLMEYFKVENPTEPFEKIIQRTIDRVKGTFAFIIYFHDEKKKLFCVRRGSPLLVGYFENICQIVSEQSGFSSEMETYIVLNNNDICILEYSSQKVLLRVNQDYKKITVNRKLIQDSPEPFQHWTLKEIYEQPQTILNALNHGGRIRDKKIHLGGIESCKEFLVDTDNIIFLGCGTSYHAGMIGRNLAKNYCKFKQISIYDAADFDEKDIPIYGKTIIIFISQSGETIDLYQALIIAKKMNIFTIGIINVIDSLIAREVDCGIYCNAEREVGVASTKAFTSQVICLALLVGWFHQIHFKDNNILSRYIDDLLDLSNQFKICIENNHSEIKEMVRSFQSNNLFLLGKDNDEYIAREGSLKIKEISYIHSEAYSSSSLKHGPFALLEKSMPVILLHTVKKNESKIMGCYEEIHSRLSPIFLITPFRNLEKKNTIFIPENNTFSFLLSIIPLQLLAYELSLQKGYNPDLPRNLAKVVTVS